MRSQNISYPILILLLLVILSLGISFSRYSTVISNSVDSSSVIVEEYELEPDWITDPDTLDVQYPGISDQNYYFSLKNTKNTDLKYKVIINMKWNADTPVVGLHVPLVMELYEVNSDNPDQPLVLVPTTAKLAVEDGTQVNSIYTEQDIISGNQSIGFCLKWSWGTSDADRNYHFANQKIDVGINVEAEK
jgi:hypothetical protein